MSTDSKYFGSNTKRGEIHELQEELNHQREDKRKEAVKKVIAAMTVGKDVSMLFTDVLNCIQTNNLELKKLVYLYVINHAKMQPERAILAVNTFQKDAVDPNPLIRALAIRTMGCIRVDKVTEYLCEPLRTCLKDKDPYVRKTAAICVAKLYDMSPELVESQGFLDNLTNLLSDSNPTVVANAVAALTEIDEISGKSVFNITSANQSKLTAALNECTEWGQVFILTALSRYTPEDSKEAEMIAERVTPRLNHANSAVVLAAVKVLMMYMEHIKSQETVKNLCKKMAPPLVTLLTTKEPEIQYVALRNINLIVQRRPSILAHEMRVFFIKYNDPIYVKMEKLEIMIMLSSEKNIVQVLTEFKEAASEVDVEFIRRAVRAIGRCAIKIESAAERCIQVLLELIQTGVNYVVQEAIVVIKDIFRKYPNKYESIIATLCANLNTLDEPEAKASMIWIVGEYAERIENADELLASFLEGFSDENTQVQLQLLTAIVKLFLKRPKDTQEMVQQVLNLATQETDNPDLRDRGYVYWRLLSTDPEAAKAVVLGEKPLISDTTTRLEENLLEELIGNISTLASVFHKPPQSFITKLKDSAPKKQKKKKDTIDNESLLPQEDLSPSVPRGAQGVDDLLGGLNLGETQPSKSTGGYGDDLFGLGAPSTPAPEQKQIVLQAQQGHGLQVAAAFSRNNGQIFMDLNFANHSQAPIGGLAIQFNLNSFGLVPSQPQIQGVMPGQNLDVSLVCGILPDRVKPGLPVRNIAEVAIKLNIMGADQVVYFAMPIPLHVLFIENGQMARDEYLGMWKNIQQEKFIDLNSALRTADEIQRKLEQNRIYYVAKRTVQNQEFLYFSARLAKPDNTIMLMELAVGGQACRLCTKSQVTDLLVPFEQSIAYLLSRP